LSFSADYIGASHHTGHTLFESQAPLQLLVSSIQIEITFSHVSLVLVPHL